MSTTAIFIVGAVIFAITVYGAVIAGGLALARQQLHEDDVLAAPVTDGELDAAFPVVEH